MTDCILDTHSLILHLYSPHLLGRKAREALADTSNTLLVPTIALLEVQYLIEIKKIEAMIGDVIGYIHQNDRMRIVAFAESELVDAVAAKGSRDPFDKIILATAQCRFAPIITRDRWMKREYSKTVW